MKKLIPAAALILTTAASAQTWLPGTSIAGLSTEANVMLDLGLVALSGWLAHIGTAFAKSRGWTQTITPRGVALGLSALIMGGIQLYLAHGFTVQAVINWVLGALFTWFVADGFYQSKAQPTPTPTPDPLPNPDPSGPTGPKGPTGL